ncbi:MAG: cyanophycinase [Sedimentitalea sp.]|uniref:cyanophycinase n=1 Tax=Sedimentitalea sp. TaxID=2048915 RepID=UPI0032655523
MALRLNSRWRSEQQRKVGLGPLLIIGGRFEDDNHRLFKAVHDHSHGDVLVFGTASGFPEEVGNSMVADLQKRGTRAAFADLTLENSPAMAFDSGLVQAIGQTGGVYFTGGDQLRIWHSLVQDGEDTPVLQALRDLRARGGLIAGSSAGAAIQSDPMLLGGSSLDSLTIGLVNDPDTPGLSLGPGLGFFEHGLVDQHFIERARVGRLVAGLRQTRQRFGFGIDENTAMLVRDDLIDVIGETGMVVADMAHARHDPESGETSDIRLSYLDDGDQFDLVKGKALPGPGKRLLRPGRANAFRSPADMPRDVFGANALHELWQRLAQGNPAYYAVETAQVADPRSSATVQVSLRRRPRVSLVYRDTHGRLSMFNFLLSLRVSAADMAHAKLEIRPEPRSKIRSASAGGGTVLVGAEPPASGNSAEAIYRRGADPVIRKLSNGKPHERSRALHLLKQAENLHLSADLRDSITHRVTHLGQSAPVRDALRARLQGGAVLSANGEAAAALGQEVITYGDANAAIRWGVSSDAGGEGLVIERGLGFVPGIVDPEIDKGTAGIGRLLVACAQRGLDGWGLYCGAMLRFDLASGNVTRSSGPLAVHVWADPDKVRSAREHLDIRDIHIAPVLAPEVNDDPEALQRAMLELAENFAAEIGAERERGQSGFSWMGDEILLRAHLRDGGAISLDVSCNRTRLTADIR